MTEYGENIPSVAYDLARKWHNGLESVRNFPDYPILPQKDKRNILITSALPYVNNIPHLGNVIGCVLSADCYARYCRLRNYQTLYICGTDEYGTATETKAIEEGLTCQQLCDKYNKCHTDVYKWFNISFDYFGRTTTNHQTQIAQDIFLKLKNNGYIFDDSLEQLFCEACQRFLADRFVEGICPFCGFEDARGDQCDGCGKLINAVELKAPKCKICRDEPQIRSSKHAFLDLPKLEPKLEEFISNSQLNGKWSPNAMAITKSWIKEGLKPRCVTRDLNWGTPVPTLEHKNKVFYVWFDAPIGYISITANYTSEWKQWWKNPSDVRLVNFMAKDNVPFHAIVFPSTLIGADDNYTLVNSISSTEYLNYMGMKFSKSRHIGVFGDDVSTTGIKSDIYRLYLLSGRPENQDSSFVWNDLITRNNNEYINNLGNFINRSLSLLYRKFDGRIKKMNLTEAEISLISKINLSLQQYINCMETFKIREAYSNMADISHTANQYFQHSKPWEIKEDDIQHLETILSFSANITALLAILLEPFAPEVSGKILADMNLDKSKHVIPDEFVRIIDEDHVINKPTLYFLKLDPKLAEALSSRFSGSQSANGKPQEALSKKMKKLKVKSTQKPQTT